MCTPFWLSENTEFRVKREALTLDSHAAACYTNDRLQTALWEVV